MEWDEIREGLFKIIQESHTSDEWKQLLTGLAFILLMAKKFHDFEGSVKHGSTKG